MTTAPAAPDAATVPEPAGVTATRTRSGPARIDADPHPSLRSPDPDGTPGARWPWHCPESSDPASDPAPPPWLAAIGVTMIAALLGLAIPAKGPGMTNRWLHPGAWWLWALGLVRVATRTANPLLLGLIVAVAALVVSSRRPQAQWAGAFAVFVRIAVLVVVIRVGFTVLFGLRVERPICSPCPRRRCPTGWPG